jgi:hypothetical protein
MKVEYTFPVDVVRSNLVSVGEPVGCVLRDNPLKSSGDSTGCVPSALTVGNSAFCIYGFSMILCVNSGYFLKQRQPADLCNGELWCSLCCTDRIPKRDVSLGLIQGVKSRE